MFVEDLPSDDFNERVSNPCPIMSSSDFTKLISADLVHSNFVGFGVVLDGDLSRHSTHSCDLPPVASLDEELDIGVHKVNGHRDILAVWEDCASVSPTLLDEAENIVPAKNRSLRKKCPEVISDVT